MKSDRITIKRVAVVSFFLILSFGLYYFYSCNKSEISIDANFENYLSDIGVNNYQISEINYTNFDNLVIEYEDENIDILIDDYIEDEMENYVEYKTIEDRNVVNYDDFITVVFSQVDKQIVEKIRVGKGNFDSKFEKWIINKRLNHNYYIKKYSTYINVIKIEKVIVPKLNEKFAHDILGYSSLSEYYEEVRRIILTQQKYQHDSQRDNAILKYIVKQSDIIIDDDELAMYAKTEYEGYIEQAKSLSIDMQEYTNDFFEMSLNDFKEYCYNNSVDNLKEIICVGFLVKEFGITINDSSVKKNYELYKVVSSDL